MNSLRKRLFGRWIIPLAALVALSALALIRMSHQSAPLDPQARIGFRWIRQSGTETAYVGSQACRSCHLQEYQRYVGSPHARTLRQILPGEKAPEFESAQTVSDEMNGVFYAVRQRDGENQVVADTGSTRDVASARWAFGSGTRARAYLSQNDDRFLQLRISYYASVRTWSFTLGDGPGTTFHGALGQPFTPVQAAACFGCHSTVLVGTREHLDLAHSHLNVGCETCHGPCRKHVESAGGTPAERGAGSAEAIVLPPTHTGPEIMHLCQTCHREPGDISVQYAGNESYLARFPGAALPRSRCFTESAGKLSCITCHDPHQGTGQQSLASFVHTCLSCHTAPHGKPCTLGKTSNCISCHMPAESITRKLPLQYHNHWIRKNPLQQGPRPESRLH